MEILIGILLTGLAEGLKKLSNKFGKELTTAGVYVILFLGAVAYAYMDNMGVFATQTYQTILTVITSAVGVYEILVKRFVKPLLDIE